MGYPQVQHSCWIMRFKIWLLSCRLDRNSSYCYAHFYLHFKGLLSDPFKQNRPRELRWHSVLMEFSTVFFYRGLPRSFFVASLLGIFSLLRKEAVIERRSRTCQWTLVMLRSINNRALFFNLTSRVVIHTTFIQEFWNENYAIQNVFFTFQ